MEENTTVPVLPSPEKNAGTDGTEAQKKRGAIVLGVVAFIIVALIIVAAVLLIRSSNETTGRIRDVFIILMALESLVIGAALVILIVQLATLINLLQNEVKPIIQSTNETVNTLRGTVTFLSDNLSEPVIKLNAYLAGLKSFLDLMRPGRKP
jgi:hypothetical protein